MEHLETRVESHYSTEGLMGRIDAALAELGVSGTDPGDLKPVDEFHTGGLEATEALLSQLTITPQTRVLDIGAGLGGTARHVLSRYGAEVTGVDLTHDFVEVAKVLNARAGLDGGIHMMQGSALDIPVAGGSTDLALMFHVGMNIADKAGLFAAVASMLEPGGRFAVYDIMRVGEGAITFPVPWAPAPEWSFVEAPDRYVAACEQAGLEITEIRDLTPLVLEVLDAAAAGPPLPATLVHLMGPDFPTMIGNLVPLVRAGTLAPTMVVARREPSAAVSG